MSVKHTISAKKVAVLLGFSALTLAVIIGSQISRQSLVEVAGSHSGQPEQSAAAQTPVITTPGVNQSDNTTPASPLPIRQPDLTLTAKGPLHTHPQDEGQYSLPPALAADIEQRRIPQSQLLLTPNRSGGYSMDAKGQYHTVIVAFIDENGQLRTEERIVYPIADEPASTPHPPQPQMAPATTEPAKP